MAQDTSYIRSFFEDIRDERGTYQNTATRIGTAFLLLLDYIATIDYPYLRKDIDDNAQGRITFLKGITARLQSLFEGLSFSDVLKSEGATDGFDGQGITMTAADGRIQTDALEVRGWMRVAKLVYNMIQVMEQDYQFSGGGDIERVVANQDGTLTLFMHKEKEGRHVSFTDFDILHGKMDEQVEVDGAYYYQTSWMRITENGITLRDGMQPDEVRVELWEDAAVPGGHNFPPKAMMTVARHGNTRDAARQSFWELSTTDQRIAYYWHVDQPILRADNYALCLGILPTILDNAGVLPSTRDRSMPGLYVNTIFYENAHHIYYPSRIVKEDRGEWTASPTAVYTGPTGVLDGDTYTQGVTVIGEPYHHEAFTRNMWLTYRLNPAYASLSDAQLRQKMEVEWHVDKETSRVWHHGALWECLSEGTMESPGFSDDWTMISGRDFYIDFDMPKGFMVPVDDVSVRAEAHIMPGTSDVTDEALALDAVNSVTWQRDSQSAAADELWTPTTESGSGGLVLLIDHKSKDPSRRKDCGPRWEEQLQTKFICTISLSTGAQAQGELGLG